MRRALIAAAALLALESALRWRLPADYGYQFPTGRMADDKFSDRAGRSFDQRAVRYVFDAEGFRSHGSADVRGRSILFLGDSFTMGMSAPDDAAFPAVVERALRARGMPVRAFNAGVSGFGAAQELRLFRRLSQSRRFDAVVWQVFPNNDLTDNWQDGGFGSKEGKLIAHDPPRIPMRIRARDAFFRFPGVDRLRLITFAANAAFAGDGPIPEPDASMYDLQKTLAAEMGAEAKRLGIPLLVVTAPTYWESRGAADDHPGDLARYERVLADLRSLNLDCLDLRGALGEEAHYVPNDGHFSILGNERAGRAVAARLLAALSDRGHAPHGVATGAPDRFDQGRRRVFRGVR